jgi:hypothetical protein
MVCNPFVHEGCDNSERSSSDDSLDEDFERRFLQRYSNTVETSSSSTVPSVEGRPLLLWQKK